MHWLAVAVIGAAVGYLGGLFGKGGSAIATPLLAAIGVPAIVAVASPLPATIPGTLVAYRRYHRLGIADARVVRWSVAVGIPTTVTRSHRHPLDRRRCPRQAHRTHDRRHRPSDPARS